MDSNRRRWIAVLVAVALLAGVAAYGLLVVDRPQIESVDNRWGTVTSERTEVVTRVAVDNPLLLRLGDGLANLRYAVTLNGIEFATERKTQVRLSGRDDEVTTTTWVNNDRIPAWWVTHVTRNETTTVTVDPSVALTFSGVEFPADEWTRERTVRTDLLDPLETDRPRRFAAFDRTLFVVNETDAEWGRVTAERTPIDASITVTNALSVPLPVTDVNYTVRMNGIVVGQGQAGEQTVIPAGATRTLAARAVINNSRLDEWWVTHLRNGETTRMTVSFDATVEYNGTERELPLEFVSFDRAFQTDVFGAENVTNRSASRARHRDGGYVRSDRSIA